jgi:hypothetical protein
MMMENVIIEYRRASFLAVWELVEVGYKKYFQEYVDADLI